MKRTQLRSKDVQKEVAQFGINLTKKDATERVETQKQTFLVINKKPQFFYYNKKPIPTLQYLQENPNALPKITVDMGAIKFVINGADVMRPGITEIDENIEAEDFITIIDEQNKKPIAVGIASKNAKDLQETTSGKVIKNIHYVGDEIWNFSL